MKPAIWVVILFCVLTCNVGCSKKDNTASPNNNNNNNGNPVDSNKVDSATLYFHLHTYLDENEVDGYNIVYTLDNGRKVLLNRAQLYVSNIQLIRTDGSFYNIPNVILLKVMETEPYLVAKIPVGNYESVRFDIGLDSTANLRSPSSLSTDPLNHSEMWFNGSAQPGGYVFVNLQGKVDTTAAANGTTAQMQPFTYKLGANNLKQVTMPNHSPVYTVDSGAIQFIHIIIDYSQLFNGVQLSNPANLSILTPADNSASNGIMVGNNIQSMFRYEE